MSDASDRDVAFFTEALHLPADQRAAFLDRACGSGSEQRRRVEALLNAHDHVGDFLEQSPQGSATESDAGTTIGEKPGDRIGRYKLLQQIGEGGCGVVYMAEQEEPVRRRVALKIIKPGMDTRSVIARFEAERQALAMMDHSGIAKVFDAGATDSGRPYFVMELVRGVKITEYCDAHALSTEERLQLFMQVCQAVQHAHQKGIIHRDIKPSNILVTRTPEGLALPVVIDFGIAKATTNQRLTDKTLFTAFEMLIGTPAYMSPEQTSLTSADVDTRTDIYSLGVLLYELLTGSTPFEDRALLEAGLDEVRRIIREQEPVRPSARLSRLTDVELTSVAQRRHAEPPTLIRSVRGDLDWIALKALAKDRSQRYDTANGLALDVQRYLANEAIAARPPSTLYRLGKAARRNKLLFGGATLVLVLLVVGLVVVSMSFARERQARKLADAALRQSEADRSAALAEAVKSAQITRFLQEMLQGVGPAVALGRDTTMLREILDAAAARVGTELRDRPATRAELQNSMGGVYEQLGLYAQAEAMHRAALAGYREAAGAESREAAVTLGILARVLQSQNRLGEAETAYRDALAVQQKVLGPEHPEIAATMHELAFAYYRGDRFAEAEIMNRKALEMRRRLLGRNHPDTVTSLSVLGLILQTQGRLTEAESAQLEVIEMRRKLLSDDHPMLASALYNLGETLLRSGRLSEAETTRREVLAIRRKVLGEAHPAVGDSLIGLGLVLLVEGNPGEAEALLRSAISILRQTLSNEHPKILFAMSALGPALEAQDKADEAEKVMREAAALWRKVRGEKNLETAKALNVLGSILTREGKLTEAQSCYQESLAMMREDVERGQLMAAWSLMGLGNICRLQGKQAEAEAMMRDAQSFQQMALNSLSPGKKSNLEELSAWFINQGRAAEAVIVKRDWARSRESDASAKAVVQP
jgi:tetratricopeptide (TPR) repeat protein/tRNA A-37 threonylcarbamoyl transferase component Bud32